VREVHHVGLVFPKKFIEATLDPFAEVTVPE
jgi:hypothetical protein